MQAAIGNKLLKSLKPRQKPFEIWDEELRGFILRVQPSGIMTYLVEYARHKRVTIGKVTALTPTQARDEAKKTIADYVRGEDPMAAKKLARGATLKTFIEDRYKGHVESRHKHAKETLRKIAVFYPSLGDKKLGEITAWAIEKHRSARLKSGVSEATTNRELAVLKAALNRAVEWGSMAVNPLDKVKAFKEGRVAVVRYLLSDEADRLRAALDKREAERQGRHENFRRWRATRGYKVPPPYGAFTNHLKPLVLLALNTGLRRGELFDLRWTDTNFAGKILIVTGRTAKSGDTRHIPLNDEAFDVLLKWKEQSKEGRVFPSLDGERLNNIKKAWTGLLKDAKITGFRFHDCRHDFASKLVMAGVDLNTVRELLGHSDIKMTLRYAHLAPEHKAAAVAKLVAKR